MIQFLRTNRYAAAVLTVIRLYIGWLWLKAGWGKITGPEPFNAEGYLKAAVAKAAGENPTVQGWWAAFLEGVAIPNAELFSFLVAWGELLAGLGLILGCFTTLAALGGVIMNFAFLLSGTLSTNPQMAILGLFVLVAGANAGRYGLDRWVIPYLKSQIKNRFGRKPGDGSAETTAEQEALAH